MTVVRPLYFPLCHDTLTLSLHALHRLWILIQTLTLSLLSLQSPSRKGSCLRNAHAPARERAVHHSGIARRVTSVLVKSYVNSPLFVTFRLHFLSPH